MLLSVWSQGEGRDLATEQQRAHLPSASAGTES